MLAEELRVALSGLPKCPPTVPDEECAKLGRDLKADGVAAVDTTTMKVVKVFEAGSDPEQFDLAADGRLYVANEDAATATVLDTRTGKIVARVPVGKEPEGVRVSPDGKWITIITYGLDVAADNHPYYKHCMIRIMPADGSAPPKVIAYVYGGQGTINVPSWSPDGTHVAFVSNSD